MLGEIKRYLAGLDCETRVVLTKVEKRMDVFNHKEVYVSTEKLVKTLSIFIDPLQPGADE